MEVWLLLLLSLFCCGCDVTATDIAADDISTSGARSSHTATTIMATSSPQPSEQPSTTRQPSSKPQPPSNPQPPNIPQPSSNSQPPVTMLPTAITQSSSTTNSSGTTQTPVTTLPPATRQPPFSASGTTVDDQPPAYPSLRPASTHYPQTPPAPSPQTPLSSPTPSPQTTLPPTPYPLTDQQSCKQYVYPEEMEFRYPMQVLQLPAVMSVAGYILDRSALALGLVDGRGREGTCLWFEPRDTRTLMKRYPGPCSAARGDPGGAVSESLMPSIVVDLYKGWPDKILSSIGFAFLHVDLKVEVSSSGGQRSSVLSLTPNGERDKVIIVEATEEIAVVYLYASHLEIGLNLVSFPGFCTTTRCLSEYEGVMWNQTLYFLPDPDTSEVKIDLSYCRFFETIRFPVTTPADRHWHILSFENETLDGSPFSQHVMVDGTRVGCLSIPKDLSKGLARAVRRCPLKMVNVVVEGAQFTLDCDPTSGASPSSFIPPEFPLPLLTLGSALRVLYSFVNVLFGGV